MIPLIVMAVSIVLARGAGMSGLLPIGSWQDATRVGLAIMFLFTATAHFTPMRKDLARMVPPALPRPELLVAVTGVLEVAGAVGLLIPSTATLSAYCLIALLIAMFPANVNAARSGTKLRGRAATPLVVRAPMQALWIGLLWWSARGWQV
jgi:uncharacterized membrane protein